MSRRKHDLGLCSTHGCRSHATIAVYPNDISKESEEGAIYSEKWRYWHKPQHVHFMLYCQEHWNQSLAYIVARNEHMFTYEVVI